MSIEPEIVERLTLQPASSSYPGIGTYERAGHTINYSSGLTRTGKSYYDSKSSIPAGYRMSTAAEELAIQLGLERAGQDPREAGVFDDLFARNNLKTYVWPYVWQWTETGLHVPKERDPSKYETDPQGRKYWVRELLIGNEAVGKILVPEGNGRVVVEWDEVSGLPRVTENIDFPHTPYTTHFRFNPAPFKDIGLAIQDVAVERRSLWRRAVDERCLVVAADYWRWVAAPGDGFRPVLNSLPKINFDKHGQ
ncbi:MAG: hypothetical protein HYS53_02070 [Candidatus Aenigmarchaeota archaeon]|nr:hypothetical protein [Candidatus Aenigmarchaeota archaeon]